MSANVGGNFGAFVPLDYLIPADPLQSRIRLRQYLNDIAQALNVKDTAYYSTQPTLCGQLFVPTFPTAGNTNTQWRPVTRLVVLTGTLATGSNNVPHGITFPSPNTFAFTRIYGVIFDTPHTTYVPIPNSDTQVVVNTTNVVITIPVGYNNYSGWVILEYITQD